MTLPRDRCRAVLPGRVPCPQLASAGVPYCEEHRAPDRDTPGSPSRFLSEWRQSAEALLCRNAQEQPRSSTAYDPDLVRTLLPAVLPLYYWYWRVRVFGTENIPATGAALLVANHSGTIPVDAAMMKVAIIKEHGRNPWVLAGNVAFRLPGFGDLVRRTGNARADRSETVALLRSGELVSVFPEGYKGIGKGWSKRYQLQRFGRGGFVEMAIETGAPIIPVAIVGAEETYPMIASLRGIPSRLGLPYIPVTPFFPLLGPFGAIPLPSKWIIAFGKPLPMIQHSPEALDDPQLILETTERIRQTVQSMLWENLARRQGVFH